MSRLYKPVLVRVEDELFSFTLPHTLFRLYIECIAGMERGEFVSLNDMARRDLHVRLQEWWGEEGLPGVPVDDFDRALELVVERVLPAWMAITAEG